MSYNRHNDLQNSRKRRAWLKDNWVGAALGFGLLIGADQTTNFINEGFSIITQKPVNATPATNQLINEVIHAGGQFFTSTLQKFDF